MKINGLPFADMLPAGVCAFESVSDRLLKCRRISEIPENAKSVIVYLFPYYLGEDAYIGSNISKYAVPADYHVIAGEYLDRAAAILKKEYPDNCFSPFCDNSPVPEVKAAYLAGLGCVGRNGLLINEEYGSFCFIGEIVTDLEIDVTTGGEKRCLECGLCRKSCPAGAVTENGILKDICLSAVTQRKGTLTPKETEAIGNSGCAWGCDVCQNVCPLNKNIKTTPIREFYETAKSIYSCGDGVEGRAFAWRGEKVIDRNIEIIGCKTGEKSV